jgi:hypothetical protein
MLKLNRKFTVIFIPTILIVGIVSYLVIINIKSSSKAYIDAEIKPIVKTATYKESSRVISNPLIGLVMDSDTEDSLEPFSLVYLGVSWKDIEPEKGKFDFQSFEGKNRFNYWKQRGVKFILRVFMDYPSNESHMDIPKWLYDEIGGKGTWYHEEDNSGFAPDYANELLLKYHKEMIKALAARYDTDSSVAYIEIGSIGHWGEWHNTYLGTRANFPTADITDLYVKDYLESFKHKLLVMRRPFQIAKDNNLGLFNDSFGDKFQTNDYFLNWIDKGYEDMNAVQSLPAMKDFWKTAPSGGEFANYPGEQYIETKNLESTIDMLKNSHTSWLGPSHPGYNKLNNEKQQNLDNLLNLMGYRYSIISSEHMDYVYASLAYT